MQLGIGDLGERLKVAASTFLDRIKQSSLPADRVTRRRFVNWTDWLGQESVNNVRVVWAQWELHD
jgi:hypothetical protein